MRVASVKKAQPTQADEKRLSPAGTIELSPGRSPGLSRRVRKVPKGRLEICWTPFRMWNLDRGMRMVIPAVPAGLDRVSESNPGLRPGLNSAVPAGLSCKWSRMEILRASSAPFGVARLKLCPSSSAKYEERAGSTDGP
jgi:hypothetical protein